MMNISNIVELVIFVNSILLFISFEKSFALSKGCSQEFLQSPRKGDYCYKIKQPENFTSKYIGCPGNDVPIDFYNNYQFLDNSSGFIYWADYTRAYEDGPFINWRVGDINMGRAVMNRSHGLPVYEENFSKDMCTTVDIRTKILMPSSCDKEFPRICELPQDGHENFRNLSKLVIKYSHKEDDGLVFELDLEIPLTTNNTYDDIWCFTDSNSFIPEKTNVSSDIVNRRRVESQIELFKQFKVSTEGDGYYWCLSTNKLDYVSNESEKVLYVKNVQKYINTYALMFKHEDQSCDFLELKLSNLVCLGRSVGGKLAKNITFYTEATPKYNFTSTFLICLEMRVKKVFEQRILVHALVNTDRKLMLSNFENVMFIRKIFACEAIENVPETKLGTKIIHLEDCLTYSCEGEFNTGSFWKISDLANCSKISGFRNDSFLKQQNSANIDVFLDEMLIDGATSTDLITVARKIERALSFETNLTISPKTFQILNEVLSNVILTKDESTLQIVQPHVTIILTDDTDDDSVIGIKIASTSLGYRNSLIRYLSSGSKIENTEINDIIINVTSLLKTRPRSRLSFVILQNDTTFLPNIEKGETVNSPIVGVSMRNITSLKTNEFIDVHFRPILEREESKKKCAFWDVTLKPNEGWSSEGCDLLNESGFSGLVTCRYYHPANFALLITSDNSSFSTKDYYILAIISQTGCIFSIMSLIFIGCTGVLFKSWRDNFMHKLWMHLSGSVGMMMISFLFVSTFDFHKKNKVICIISGVTMHYSVLATFCWMLVEAMFYYQMAADVCKYQTSSGQSRMIKAIIVGWVLPTVPVIVLLLNNTENYSVNFSAHEFPREFCYPSGFGFWIAIFFPVFFVVICNSVIFIYILIVIYKPSLIKKHTENDKIFFKTFFSFFYQFGLMWVFGLLSNYLVMAYLFCITSTFQGLILLFFFVLGDQKTRWLWKVKLNFTSQNPLLMILREMRSRNFRPNRDYPITNKTLGNDFIEYVVISSSCIDDKKENM